MVSDLWLKSSVIVFAQSTQAFAMGVIALFLPLIRNELNISFGQAGLLAAVPTFCYALMQVPVGLLTDRFNPKVLFAFGVLTTNVAGIVFAFATSFPLLLLVQSIAGLTRAFMFIPGMILMTQQFSEARRTSAMALLFAGALSSYVIVDLLGPLLLVPLGWHGFLVVLSLAGIAIAICVWLIVPRGRSAVQERNHPVARSGVWSDPTWWVIGFIQFVRMGVMAGFTFWLPAYLVLERGLPIAFAGFILAGTYAIAAAGNVLGSAVSDRWRTPVPIIGFSLLVLAVLLFVIGYAPNIVLLIATIAAIAVFLQFYFGSLFVIPVEIFGRTVRGLSTGFGSLAANIGAVCASLGLGLIKDATNSFEAGFVCIAIAALTAALATVGLARLIRNARNIASAIAAIDG